MAKYFPGDRLGKRKILFIEEKGHDNNNKRLGRFQCPDCDSTEWITRVSDVANNKSKRCLNCKPQAQSGLNNSIFQDLTGKRYGNLLVLGLAEADKQKKHKNIWKCECQCTDKNIVYVSTNQLNFKNITSCGCGRRKDLTGKRFGKLIALYPTERRTNNQSVIWHCKCDCGNDCEYSVDRLERGEAVSCGCLVSKGEEKLKKILQNLDIFFIQQYKFLDCMNPKTGCSLYFDFYLPDYNCCIEYDGEQHFHYADSGWNTKENFEKNKYRDDVKNQYCKKNNIKLIRIPYWDYDKLNTDFLLQKIKE